MREFKNRCRGAAIRLSLRLGALAFGLFVAPAMAAEVSLSTGATSLTVSMADATVTDTATFPPTGNVPYVRTNQNLTATAQVTLSWDGDTALFPKYDPLNPGASSIAVALRLQAEGGGCLAGTTDTNCYLTLGTRSVSATSFDALGKASLTLTYAVAATTKPTNSDWIMEKLLAGAGLRAVWLVDPNKVLADTLRSNNRVQTGLFNALPLTGRLAVFPSTVPRANTVQVDGPGDVLLPAPVGSVCAVSELRFNQAEFDLPLTGLNTTATATMASDLCAATSLAADQSGFDLGMVSGSFDVAFPAPLSFSGATAILGTGAMTTGGLTFPVGVVLPPAVSLHNGASAPRPVGSRVVFDATPSGYPNATLTDFDTAELAIPLASIDLWLHGGALPFYGRLAALALDAAQGAVTGKFSELLWVQQRAYDPLDPRVAGSLPASNDARFARPQPGTVPFTIGNAGLNLSAQFAGSKVSLHFPRVALDTNGFTVEVAENQLLAADVPVDNRGAPLGDAVLFEASPRCGLCATDRVAPGKAPRALVATEYALDPTMQVGADGAVMLRTGGSSDEVGFGEYDLSLGFTFQRVGDVSFPSMFYAPGYEALGTADSDATALDYLLGSRAPGVVGLPSDVFLVGSESAELGNYFFAGVNRGPEIFEDPVSRQPAAGAGFTLDRGTETRIAFNGHKLGPAISVPSSAATKYVWRPGGVTGSFNTNTPPEPSLYGYVGNLTRFGFRTWANVLDPEADWIAGTVTVPGKADFSLTFRQLGLDCLGRFTTMTAAIEACDKLDNNGNGLIDENCGERLGAWTAPYTPFSGYFASPTLPGAVCEVDARELTTWGSATFRALSQAVGLKATWTRLGEPRGPVEISNRKNVLIVDKPGGAAGEAGASGFRVGHDGLASLKTPAGNPTDGWLEIAGTVLPGFWAAEPIDLRVANQTVDISAQTIMAPRGGLQSTWAGSSVPDTLSNSDLAPLMVSAPEAEFDFDYYWSENTSFSLPAFYQPGRLAQDIVPQFTGVYRSVVDVPALSIGGVMKYARPQGTTAIDFGLSADVNVVAEAAADLHIDLNDPTSLLRLDTFLAEQFGITGNPVEVYLGDVHRTLDIYRNFTTDGLETVLRNQLRERIPDDAVMPLVEAGAWYRTQASEVLEGLVGSMLEPIAAQQISPDAGATEIQALATFLTSLDDQLVAFYIDAAQDIIDAAVQGTQTQVEYVNSQIALLEKWGDQSQDALDVIDQLIALVNEIDAGVASGIDALTVQRQGIQQVMLQADNALQLSENLVNTLALADCSIGERLLDQAGNAVLDELGNPIYIGGNPLTGVLRGLEEKISAMVGVVSADELASMINLIATAVGFDAGPLNDLRADLARDHAEAIATIEALIDELKARLACGENPDIDLQESTNNLLAVIAAVRAEIAALDARITTLDAAINDAEGPVVAVREGLASARKALNGARIAIADLATATRDIASAQTQGLLPVDLAAAEYFPDLSSVRALQDAWDAEVFAATDGVYGFIGGAVGTGNGYASAAASVMNALLEVIESQVQEIAREIDVALQPVTGVLTSRTTVDEWKDWMVDAVFDSPPVSSFLADIKPSFEEIDNMVESLVLDLLDAAGLIANRSLEVLASGSEPTYTAENADGTLAGMPKFFFAEVDGYAAITDEALTRLRINGEWQTGGSAPESRLEVSAGLDIRRTPRFNDADGCSPYSSEAEFDAGFNVSGLSAFGLDVVGQDGYLRNFDLHLVFSDGRDVVGAHGAIGLNGFPMFGVLTFQEAGFAFSAGGQETWFGAHATATLTGLGQAPVSAALVFGESCSAAPLEAYDPSFAEFVDLPGAFDGFFVRGGVTVPIIDYGCAARVGVNGDVAFYNFAGAPTITGGILGGGVFGKAACVAAARGQATLFTQWRSGSIEFRGEAFGVAGVGFDCNPETWTTIPRSRDDSWCGTGDVGINASFSGGSFSVSRPSIGAIY